jgi:ubiquinone/menaquinone biosynthesis C-methylase UbiE
MPTNFDGFSQQYEEHIDSCLRNRLTGEKTEYFIQLKVIELKRALAQLGCLQNMVIADIGCGTGLAAKFLTPLVARVLGVDVSKGMLMEAKKRSLTNAEFLQTTGSFIPISSNSVDAAFAMCLVHHLNPDEVEATITEMIRIVKPKGLVICFEHNPLNPLTRYVVKNTPLDSDAKLYMASTLSDFYRKLGLDIIAIRYIIFFPRLLKLLRPLEPWLSWLPLGGQYYIVGKQS